MFICHGDALGLRFAAYCTSVGLDSRILACRLGRHFSFVPGVISKFFILAFAANTFVLCFAALLPFAIGMVTGDG